MIVVLFGRCQDDDHVVLGVELAIAIVVLGDTTEHLSIERRQK